MEITRGYAVAKEVQDADQPQSFHLGSQDSGLWKQFWAGKAHPKIINLIWRACRHALATQMNLFRRR